MLEDKNHKKISLSGKSLLMGTLSTAAIILSASTANAATNDNETPVGSAPVLDTPSSAKDTTPGTDLSNNGSESVITDNSNKNDSKKRIQHKIFLKNLS